MRKHERWKTDSGIRGVIHNCDTLIVNVRNFVEFFLNLGVFPRWSSCQSQLHCQQESLKKAIHYPIRVEIGLVHAVWNHCAG